MYIFRGDESEVEEEEEPTVQPNEQVEEDNEWKETNINFF